jgi:hypothetical protein
MIDYVNAEGWELIEKVGLPFKNGEVDQTVYDTCNQGKTSPADQKPGDRAALERLKIGLAFSERPKDFNPKLALLPEWTIPDYQKVLEEVRRKDSSLDLIRKMLESIDPFDTTAQMDHIETIKSEGLSDDGSGSTRESQFEIRTGSMFLLGAACDMSAALALGFGTTDFPVPPIVSQEKKTMPSIHYFDYMVAANFNLPPNNFKVRIAALGAPALHWPVKPTNFRGEEYSRSGGNQLDGHERENVRLLWGRQHAQVSPHGFFLGIKEWKNDPVFLNACRGSSGSFCPVIPATRPDGNKDQEENVTFIVSNRIVPFVGTKTDVYSVAAQDVFGRCSDWNILKHTVKPGRPAIPSLLEIKFLPSIANATGRSIPASLQIDMVWDWEDRGPAKIEFAGKFFKKKIGRKIPNGIQYSIQGMSEPMFYLKFKKPAGKGKDEVPILCQAKGEVKILEKEKNDDEVVKYRITVEGFILDFEHFSQLNYMVFVRAAEKVNEALNSDFSAAKATNIKDPLPAAAPDITPCLQWAALPDATGTSRCKIKFKPVDFASGYVIYGSTESSILNAEEIESSPMDSLSERLQKLMGLPFSDTIKDTFTRLTRDPLFKPEIEVSLPSSSETLYVYHFSSLTENNVESERSGAIYVAVPQRSMPGAPFLQIKKSNEGNGNVQVMIEAGAGDPPCSMELFRTRSPMLSTDINKMGPPVYKKSSPKWKKYDREMAQVKGKHNPSHYFLIQDSVKPGWFPYYYRAVAWGKNDPEIGIYPGRSQSSAAINFFLPPSTSPDLIQPLMVHAIQGKNLWKISFLSGAEWRLPPCGAHVLTIQTCNILSPEIKYTKKIKLELYKAEESSPGQEEKSGKIYRHSKDQNGRWQYDAYLAIDTDNHVAVMITDPLERRSSASADLLIPDLADVQFKCNTSVLTIWFKSSIPITPYKFPDDDFIVEIFNATGRRWHCIDRFSIHEPGLEGKSGKFIRDDYPGNDGRYQYSFACKVSSERITKVAVCITAPNGLKITLTS